MKDDSGVKLSRNNSKPELIVDVIDGIQVVEKSEDVYQIDYCGYTFGRLLVDPAGVEALGEKFLGKSQKVPPWLLVSKTVDSETLP